MIRHADIIGEWVINRSIRDIINKKEFKLSGNGIFTNKNNIFHYKCGKLVDQEKIINPTHIMIKR